MRSLHSSIVGKEGRDTKGHWCFVVAGRIEITEMSSGAGVGDVER
jgi:hypothetical protein